MLANNNLCCGERSISLLTLGTKVSITALQHQSNPACISPPTIYQESPRQIKPPRMKASKVASQVSSRVLVMEVSLLSGTLAA